MIAKIKRQSKYQLTVEWIKKMWDTHTQQNTTQPKKKKKRNLAIVTTGMDLKNIMLNEKSQIDMYCMFLLIRGI